MVLNALSAFRSLPARPFIVLALPRTGTRMFADALASHPRIGFVAHEFLGGFWDFVRVRYVLSNYWRRWMRPLQWCGVRVIHLYREDAIAGAISMLMMHYHSFPDGVVDLPPAEVEKMARKRREWDTELARHADHSISYEQLCRGREVKELPAYLCDWLGVYRSPLVTRLRKTRRVRLRNEAELSWLNV